jgi:hypothetical protein
MLFSHESFSFRSELLFSSVQLEIVSAILVLPAPGVRFVISSFFTYPLLNILGVD